MTEAQRVKAAADQALTLMQQLGTRQLLFTHRLNIPGMSSCMLLSHHAASWSSTVHECQQHISIATCSAQVSAHFSLLTTCCSRSWTCSALRGGNLKRVHRDCTAGTILLT